MSRESFEVTKEGVKLSYVRFLSDSAAGYVLLLVVIYACLTAVPIPWSPITWKDFVPVALNTVTTETLVFLGILILVLGSPLGLMLNATSWFLLGRIQIWFINFWVFNYRHIPLTYSTVHLYDVEILESAFTFIKAPSKQRGLYNEVKHIERVLETYFPEVEQSLDYLLGLKNLTRNLAFICLVIAIYSLLIQVGVVVYITFILAVLLLGLTCYTELYTSLEVLSDAYVICYEVWGIHPQEPQNATSLIETLIRIHKKDKENRKS
jgi:hypothetical protein